MKKSSRKILSVLLAVIMVLSIVPMAGVNSFAAGSESEPNDSSSNADSISLNTSYSGVISSYGDNDYYKFTLPKQGYITISFGHVQLDSGDWNVFLYNADEDLAAGTSWEFKGKSSKTGTTENIGLPAGTYYIEIASSGYGNAAIGVAYNFKVNFIASSVWESELNDSLTKADPIKLNTAYNGVIIGYGDNDYYKFTLPKQGYISLSFGHRQLDSGDWNVYLYDADGNFTAGDSYWEFKGKSSKTETTENIGLPAGTYYIEIASSGYGNSSIGVAYNFKVNFGRITMHRLYNPNSGEHFYTADVNEKDHLDSIGWDYEGIGWYAPETSSTPVYRLYNAPVGEHHYTTDVNEKNHLVSLGWTYEGVGWYSDDAKGVPLYRQYNPNAFANNHNYTTDKGENDWLVSLGWRAEGIGWYGVA